MMNEKTWQTSDLPAAAFAVYCGLDLQRVLGGSRATFVFQTTAAWPGLLADFEAGRARVEPQRYHLALKAARTAVYDGNVRRAQEQAALARALAGGEVGR
ncbi:MAG: hypothetical protein FJ015_06660 [Chloroflexi bacterium]|nr:hypothetical protein [Chloroflexota bacterium]